MIDVILASLFVVYVIPMVITGILCAILIPYILIQDKYVFFADNNSYAVNQLMAVNKNYVFYSIVSVYYP